MLLLVIIIFISPTFQAHSRPSHPSSSNCYSFSFLAFLSSFLIASPCTHLFPLPLPATLFLFPTPSSCCFLFLSPHLNFFSPALTTLPLSYCPFTFSLSVADFPVPTFLLLLIPFMLLLLLFFLLLLFLSCCSSTSCCSWNFCCFSYCPLPVFPFSLPFPPFLAPPLLKQYNQVNYRINCIHLGTPTEKRLSVIQKVADCLLDQQSVTIGECIGKGRCQNLDIKIHTVTVKPL